MEMLVLELNSWATHEMGKFVRERAAFGSGAYEDKNKINGMGEMCQRKHSLG